MMKKLKNNQRYAKEMEIYFDDKQASVELTTLVAHELTYQNSLNSIKTEAVTTIAVPDHLKDHGLLGFCPVDLEKPFWLPLDKILSLRHSLKVWLIKGSHKEILVATPAHIESVKLVDFGGTQPASAYQADHLPRQGY